VLALGGFHPTNAERDQEVRAAAVIIALASLPAAILLVESLRRRERAGHVLLATALLLLPIAVAACVLWLIASVDMEPGGVPIGG
jgi:hypothetical protein